MHAHLVYHRTARYVYVDLSPVLMYTAVIPYETMEMFKRMRGEGGEAVFSRTDLFNTSKVTIFK